MRPLRASFCHHLSGSHVVQGDFVGYSLDNLACIRLDGCGVVVVIHPSWVTLFPESHHMQSCAYARGKLCDCG